ncbi:MAG: hypothetical protein MJ086_00315 [Lachnospiraceae bacterium]|nr:hypothetical protein [Lachnospiraceae bacterium]
MKFNSKKFKMAVATALAFVTILCTTILSFAAERESHPYEPYSDRTIFIACGIFAVVIIVGTCTFGIILRRAQNRAHKEWLDANNLTEEEAQQQAKEYKEAEKKRKQAMRAKKKARRKAMRQMKKINK